MRLGSQMMLMKLSYLSYVRTSISPLFAFRPCHVRLSILWANWLILRRLRIYDVHPKDAKGLLQGFIIVSVGIFGIPTSDLQILKQFVASNICKIHGNCTLKKYFLQTPAGSFITALEDRTRLFHHLTVASLGKTLFKYPISMSLYIRTKAY